MFHTYIFIIFTKNNVGVLVGVLEGGCLLAIGYKIILHGYLILEGVTYLRAKTESMIYVTFRAVIIWVREGGICFWKKIHNDFNLL